MARLASSERQTPSTGFQPTYPAKGGGARPDLSELFSRGLPDARPELYAAVQREIAVGPAGGEHRLSKGAAIVVGAVAGAITGAAMGLLALGGDALLRAAGATASWILLRGVAGGVIAGATLGFFAGAVPAGRSLRRVIQGMLASSAILVFLGAAGAAGTLVVAGWLGWALGGAVAGAAVGLVLGVFGCGHG
jgi:hypothetical protein